MADSMHQPRDENGQYVSLGTLFERERVEHSRDHERERQVVKDTAQRLEREVEQTAQRLERVVEETAVRIEKAVETALQAVAATARVHADAHSKEHVAHEKIHMVEKQQVDKALDEGEKTARLHQVQHQDQHVAHEAVHLAEKFEVERAEASMEKRLEGMNEFRSTLRDQNATFVSRELFDREHERLITVEKRLAFYSGMAAVAGFALSFIVRLLGVG